MVFEAGAFTANRPSFLVNGQAYDLLDMMLTSLTISHTVSDLSRCQARFGNHGVVTEGEEPGYLFFDNQILAFGNEINVASEENSRLFQGRITALEGLYFAQNRPEIQVYAEDGLEALRHTRRSRSFEEMTDVEVIEALAGEYGLQPHISILNPAPHQAVITQVDETDLAFLQRRARRLGATFRLEGSTLFVQTPTLSGETISLTMGKNLKSFRVRADLSDQVTELGVTGWDVANKEALAAVADDSLVSTGLFGFQTGSAILAAAFGERFEQEMRQVPLRFDEAEALAGSLFLSRARRFVVGDGVSDVNPALMPGKLVSLQGLGPWFDGMYHLIAVRHTFNAGSGFRTSFTVERPAIEEASGSGYGRLRRRKPRRGDRKKRLKGRKKGGKGDLLRQRPAAEMDQKPDLAETKLYPPPDDLKTPSESAEDPGKTRRSKEKKSGEK